MSVLYLHLEVAGIVKINIKKRMVTVILVTMVIIDANNFTTNTLEGNVESNL